MSRPKKRYRFIKEYAGSQKACFIEGITFKTVIPLSNTIIPGLLETNDTVNDTVKLRLIKIIRQLQTDPGLRIIELTEKFNVSEITIKRDMQRIRPLVEYRSSQKNGGYFLTEFMQTELNSKK
ncbi:MAG TPA: HTH domain-containing protein [Arachidicoccus sp.]